MFLFFLFSFLFLNCFFVCGCLMHVRVGSELNVSVVGSVLLVVPAGSLGSDVVACSSQPNMREF